MNEDKSDENNLNGEHSRIGNYKLLEVIGKRGKSIVYIALQESPTRRKVVLRLIETGMDRNEVMASFKSIKQASTNISHTNIARFLDAGITDMGYAYFVTEYVPGLSITEYCDKYKLTIADRLALFNEVCRIIQEAHFKGIVHLGLRPSSVLVTFDSGKPVIKIVDFGIAKVLADQDLIENSLHTGLEADAPVYMSPEQAALSDVDIDTRTDIYSLGVLLYELLTGVPLFDKNELAGTEFMEILKKVREETPLNLSVRLDSLSEDEADEMAKKRRKTVPELKKELQGDLNSIVKKALAKDRKDRYDSAGAMRTDITRFLSQEPVLAHPATISYNARKFFEKNRFIAIAMMAVILLAVLLYILNVTSNMKAESAREKAVAKRMDSDYYYASALKDKAVAYAQANQWQLVRLFSVNSLFFQAKARNYFTLGDIPLPFEFQCWIIKYSLSGFSPLLSISSDSRYIASGDKEGIIKIWDGISGKEAATLKGNMSFIQAVSFSPDGQYIAAAGKETVKLWDISKQKEIASFVPLTDKQTIRSVRYSPDGQYLSACGTKEITIWETSGGTVVASLKETAQHMNRVGFSPDNQYLTGWNDNGDVKLYFLANPGTFRVLKTGGEPVYSICFSPDGKYVAAGGGSGVDIWDISNREVVTRLPGDDKDPVVSVCFSPDGGYAVSGSRSGTIRIFKMEIPQTIETSVLKIGDTPVIGLEFSPNGKYLAAGGGDRVIRVWETYSEKKAPLLQGSSGYGESVCFSFDGKYLAAGGNKTVRIWETDQGRQVLTLTGLSKPINVLKFSPDNKHIAVGGEQTVSLWDISSGKQTATLEGVLKGLNSIAFGPRGKYLAGSGDRAVMIWEISSGSEVAVFYGDAAGIGPVSFSPDGRYLAAGDSSGRIKIRNLSTLEIEAILKEHDGSITALCFSPDGKYLSSSSSMDKAIKIRGFKGSPEPYDLHGHKSEVTAVTFSPDGKYVVSTGKTGTIKIWDLSRREEIATLRGSGKLAAALDFSPAGKYIAAGYGDNIKIWDFAYFSDYLNFDVNYPYEAEDVRQLLTRVEKETGFVLDGIHPVTPENAYTYYNRGETYLENREYHKAVAAYKKSMELTPDNAAAWYELGMALLRTKEFGEAADALRQALKLRPGSPKAWYELGVAYRQKGDYDRAVEALQKAIELKPLSAKSRYELGRAFVLKKDNNRAIENFRKAVEVMPDYEAAWYKLGQTYDRVKEYDEAVTAYEKALALTPADESAWNSLGITLNKMNDYDGSIRAFRRVVELNPEFAAAWNNMAITYRNKGDYQKAVENHMRAVDVNPAYDLAWDALGNTYNTNKEYTKAIDAYKRAIKINPRSWNSHGNIGFIYIIKEEYEKAIDAFEKTVKINPGFFAAWNSLGDLYAREGEYKSSVDAYLKAVKIKPDDNDVRNNLGKSYYFKEDYGDAMKQFRKAVEIKSRDFSAHFHIALTYLAQKKFEDAFDYYLKVMEQLQPDKEYMSIAIKDIDKLLEKNPDYNFAYLVRRFLYNKAGDKTKAREDLERFIDFIKSSKGK
ncbi:tetratricopeptide repeat protein [Acidobacteriota bacterium]